MNSPKFLLRDESMQNSHRIDTLLEKLKIKLSNFIVLNNQGNIFAEVVDLKLDSNKQINLVLSTKDSLQQSHLVLLVSKLVQKIDPLNKTILANINQAESEKLPQCITKETQRMEFPEVNNNPTTPERVEESNTITHSSSESNAMVASQWSESGILTDEVIRLLGERVIVDRNKRKVGEVIVRKEIETRMVEIPVRREKLIVEQVSPERKQLAEIELGQQEITGLDLREVEVNQLTSPNSRIGMGGGSIVSGEFDSPKIASLLLNAIALERRHGCKKIRIEVVVEDTERKNTYQEWFERASGKSKTEVTK
jgi:stress response protein YsnF